VFEWSDAAYGIWNRDDIPRASRVSALLILKG
jgi:hypothetical protein